MVTAQDKRLIATRAAAVVVMVDALVLAMLAATHPTVAHVRLAVAVSATLVGAAATGGYLQHSRVPRRGRRAKSEVVVQILGGPCDGKWLTLPARRALPHQLLVRHPGRCWAQRSRYVHVPAPDAALRYRYDRTH